LSEALCHNAKKLSREQDSNSSSLDWHIAASGLIGSIEQIRQREYTVQEGRLYMRPIYLRRESDVWRTWPDFCETVQALRSSPNWVGKNNKVKHLREVLREGHSRTQQFLKLYRLTDLPGYMRASNTLRKTGWEPEMCGYFDPIEAMDFVRKEYQCDELFAEDTPAK
jgi:hypothetical protein